MTVLSLLLGIKFGFENTFGDITFTFYLLFFPTIMIAALNINWIKGFFSLPPFVFLGKISMAVFLIHVPILNFFSIYIHPSHGILYSENSLIRYDTVQGFFLILASIIIVSVIWHYTIEKKVIPLFLQKTKLMIKNSKTIQN